MAIAANVEQFLVKIEGYDERLRIMHMTGEEGINRLYQYALELVTEDPDVDLDAWLGKRVTVQLMDDYERIERHIHHFPDLLRVHLPEAAAEHGEVL